MCRWLLYALSSLAAAHYLQGSVEVAASVSTGSSAVVARECRGGSICQHGGTEVVEVAASVSTGSSAVGEKEEAASINTDEHTQIQRL